MCRNKWWRCGAIAAAMLCTSGALADGPNWTFLEAGYQRIDIDDSMLSYEPDGYVIDGSFAVHENVFLFAGYGVLKDDPFDVGSDLKYTAWDAGIGYNLGLSDSTDIFASLSYVNAELDDGVISISDDGYGASLGIRTAPGSFDLGAAINYVDFGGTDGDDVSLAVGAAYLFTDNFAGCIDASFGDDMTSYGAGLRVYF